MKTAAELAAFLVTEGLLPTIAGQAPLAPPPAGATQLSPEERVAAGFPGFGMTMRYPAADGFVLGDMGHHTATLRLNTANHAATLATLKAHLVNGMRDVQTGGAAPVAAGRAQEIFMIRVSEKRYARVTVIYATSAGADAPFDIAVTGMEAVGHRSGGTVGPAPGLRGPLAAPQAAP